MKKKKQTMGVSAVAYHRGQGLKMLFAEFTHLSPEASISM